MKALTIKQPSATAIMQGSKRVENRSWFTRFRGRIVVHAGQSWDSVSAELLRQAGAEFPAMDILPRQAALGTINLIDIVPMPQRGKADPYGLLHDPLATGPFCWILRQPRYYRAPIYCKGRLSLWSFDGRKLRFRQSS